MKEKIMKVVKEVISRLKSPVVWAGTIAVVGLIFTTAGYGLDDIPSWAELGKVLIAIVSNPSKIALIVVAFYGLVNNPATKDKF